MSASAKTVSLAYTIAPDDRRNARVDVLRQHLTGWPIRFAFVWMLGIAIVNVVTQPVRPATWTVAGIFILAALIGGSIGLGALVLLFTRVPANVAADVTRSGITGTFDGRTETIPWEDVLTANDLARTIVLRRRLRAAIAIPKSKLPDGGAALWKLIRRSLDPRGLTPAKSARSQIVNRR